MERICPRCKENLGRTGEYFCFNCGYRLPPELVIQLTKQDKIHAFPPSFVIKEDVAKIPKKFLKEIGFGVFCVLVVASVFFVVRFLLDNPTLLRAFKSSKDQTPAVVRRVEEVLDIDLPVYEFGSQKLAAFIPSEIDFYFEGSNLSKTAREIVSPSPDVGLKVYDLAGLTDGEFVFFSKLEDGGDGVKSRKYGLLAKLKNIEDYAKIDEFAKGKGLSSALLENYAVVSNSPGMVGEVRQAKEKTILNFSLNPKYAAGKNSVSAQGKLLIMVLSDTAKAEVVALRTNFEFRGRSSEKFFDFLEKQSKTSYTVN